MEPADRELFNLFRAAIATGLEYVRRHNAVSRYLRRHREWPQLAWRTNGTPMISEAYEGPFDYADAIFPFIIDPRTTDAQFLDEPSYASLKQYALQHSRISEHLGAATPDLFESQLRRLIGDVLDCYVHGSGPTELNEEMFLKRYLPIEAYLLNEKLNIAIIVPILCLLFDDERVELNEQMCILKLHDQLHLARAPKWNFEFQADPRVLSTATHALVLTYYTVPNETQIQIWRTIGSAASYPLKEIDNFFAALRIATGYSTGYGQLLMLPLGWASGYKADLLPLEKTTVRNYPSWFEENYWNAPIPRVTALEASRVATLARKIQTLEVKQLAVALRRLNLSTLRSTPEDGLLDTMIGLEALLSDGAQEMTHKIAMRMAALYKLEQPCPPRTTFKEMKAIYKLRSKVVHGGDFNIDERITRGEEEIRIVDAAIEHLRAALRILINNPEYFDVNRIDHALLLGIDAGTG